MDNRFHVPKLERSNSLFWKMTIESAATTLDATAHITGSTPPLYTLHSLHILTRRNTRCEQDSSQHFHQTVQIC